MINLSLRFQEEKMLKLFFQRKTKLRASILAVLLLKVLKSLSMKVFAATISYCRVNAKRYGQKNRLKLSGLAMDKSKSEFYLKMQFLELLASQICKNYFQAMTFSLNKFTFTFRH